MSCDVYLERFCNFKKFKNHFMKRILLLVVFLISVSIYTQTMFAPFDGFSTNPITVTITSNGNNQGTIYYTTNGQTPTLSSTSAQAPINVSVTSTTTFKAFYVLNGNTSAIEEMTYYIGSYPKPMLFFKPPATWTNSCAYMNIVEPRTLVDFFPPGPQMEDTCNGWKKTEAIFAKGWIDFNNCLGAAPPPIYQSVGAFLTNVNVFYDYSSGHVTNPPVCLLSVSDSEIKKNVIVKVYPNPVSDVLKFQSERNFVKYEILDSSGKLVKSADLKRNEIAVSYLNSGVYNVKIIERNNEFAVLRFIKK